MRAFAHYYEGGGRRFVYATDATFRCPYAEGLPPELRRRVVDGFGMARLDDVVKKAHQRAPRVRADDVPGDRCATCGAKLEKVGYAAWIEAPAEEVAAEHERRGEAEEAARVRSSAAVAARLGGGGFARWPGGVRYFGLKREAIGWCRDRAAVAKG